MVLDKTGTLTAGRLHLVHAQPFRYLSSYTWPAAHTHALTKLSVVLHMSQLCWPATTANIAWCIQCTRLTAAGIPWSCDPCTSRAEALCGSVIH